MYTLDFIRYQENRFDSFCKTVIRNASLDKIRSRKKREALFSSLDDFKVISICRKYPRIAMLHILSATE